MPLRWAKFSPYRFPLRSLGTFLYHTDNKVGEQVARGLYGPLIVYEEGRSSSKGDIALLVDYWRLDDEIQIQTASFDNLLDWSHGGQHGNFLTVNSRSEPKIKIPAQGLVRLRFISVANARNIRFAFSDNQSMRVIAVDGASFTPFDVDKVVLAPVKRVDVLIEDTSVLTSISEVSTGDRIIVASFMKGNDLSPLAPPTLNAFQWYEKPDATKARKVVIHMQVRAMGNLMRTEFDGTQRTLHDIARKEKNFWPLTVRLEAML